MLNPVKTNQFQAKCSFVWDNRENVEIRFLYSAPDGFQYVNNS